MADMRVVGECSPWDGRRFDPATHIRAVNHLCSTSKEEALAALRSYAADHAADVMASTRVMLLARLLFTSDAGFPPLRVGAPTDAGPVPATLPRYPLALIRDVPLLVVPGFVLGGFPEPVSQHLEHYARHGALRPAPLSPPDDPLALADELVSPPDWHRPQAQVEEDRALLRAQLLRLVRDVHPVAGVDDPAFYTRLRTPATWEREVMAFRGLGARWNGDRYRMTAQREE